MMRTIPDSLPTVDPDTLVVLVVVLSKLTKHALNAFEQACNVITNATSKQVITAPSSQNEVCHADTRDASKCLLTLDRMRWIPTKLKFSSLDTKSSRLVMSENWYCPHFFSNKMSFNWVIVRLRMQTRIRRSSQRKSSKRHRLQAL